jgi:hypothetical protein
MKKKKKKKKSNNALILALVGGGLLLVGGVVVVVVINAKSPAGNQQAKAKDKDKEPPKDQPKVEPKPKKGKDLVSQVARRVEKVEVDHWFHQLGLAYQTAATANTNGRGPANFKDLGREFANTPLNEWFMKDWIKIVWSANLFNQPNGSSNTALAWETDADSVGNRVVLMCDGSVVFLSEQAFQKTPKATGR